MPGKPPDKYAVLADALDWTTNIGYPGYATAAIDEVFSTWVLNTMFAQASTGAKSPEGDQGSRGEVQANLGQMARA